MNQTSKRNWDAIDAEAAQEGAAIRKHNSLRPRNVNQGGTKNSTKETPKGRTTLASFAS